MYPQPRLTRRQKVTLVVVFVVFVLIGLGVLMRPKPNPKIDIAGLGAIEATSDRKTAISKTMYNVLENNISPDARSSVKDAEVRDDSYIDNYDVTKNVHYASFIVDIPSIRQSYLVYYEWSSRAQNPNVSGYPVTIQCLPKNLLKYGEFNCQPIRVAESTNAPDIINRYLPYHVESKYKITSSQATAGKPTVLSVEAYMPGWVAQMTPEILSGYTSEINIWIESKGLSPDNYTIEYLY